MEQNYSAQIKSKLGYPHCILHWSGLWILRALWEKQSSSHRELPEGAKLEQRTLGLHSPCCLFKSQGLWIYLHEEQCVLNKENGHFPQHLKSVSQMCKLISCIFKVLSNDLRGQQLLDTSLKAKWSNVLVFKV